LALTATAARAIRRRMLLNMFELAILVSFLRKNFEERKEAKSSAEGECHKTVSVTKH
jgi:hypothetical protein